MSLGVNDTAVYAPRLVALLTAMVYIYGPDKAIGPKGAASSAQSCRVAAHHALSFPLMKWR